MDTWLVHRVVCLSTLQLLLILIEPTSVQGDGQAELTWVADSTEMVYLHTDGHPSQYLRARRRAITLIEINMLPRYKQLSLVH